MSEEKVVFGNPEVKKTALTWQEIIEAKAKKLGLTFEEGISGATVEDRMATYQKLIDKMPEHRAIPLSPEKKSARVELDHSIKLLRAGLADPIEANIGGVYPTLLTENDALKIDMEAELLLALINHLLMMNQLFTAHLERTRIISTLSVKLRKIPEYKNFKERARFYTPTPA